MGVELRTAGLFDCPMPSPIAEPEAVAATTGHTW